MKKRKLAEDEYEVEAILDMRLKVDDSIRGTKGEYCNSAMQVSCFPFSCETMPRPA